VLAKYLSLDGFRRDWVAARIDDCGAHDSDFSSNLEQLLSIPHRRAMIDRKQRIEILKRMGFKNIEAMLGRRWGTGIGRDDLIDAYACAIAARFVDYCRILV
jgi:hypothetical protein